MRQESHEHPLGDGRPRAIEKTTATGSSHHQASFFSAQAQVDGIPSNTPRKYTARLRGNAFGAIILMAIGEAGAAGAINWKPPEPAYRHRTDRTDPTMLLCRCLGEKGRHPDEPANSPQSNLAVHGEACA